MWDKGANLQKWYLQGEFFSLAPLYSPCTFYLGREGSFAKNPTPRKTVPLQFRVENNALTKSFLETLVASVPVKICCWPQKYQISNTGDCLIRQRRFLYNFDRFEKEKRFSGCPVQVINDSRLSGPVSRVLLAHRRAQLEITRRWFGQPIARVNCWENHN